MAELTEVKQNKRQVVSDVLVTDEMVNSIAEMVIGKLEDVFNPSQKEIVSILMHTRLTYQTMARVVKVFLPEANPTANSIRSLVNHIKAQDEIMGTFLEELKKDIESYEQPRKI